MPVKVFLAALILGISPRTLRETLENHQVDVDCDSSGCWPICLDPDLLGLREMLFYYKEATA